MEGFTVRNGNASNGYGGGVHCYNSVPTLNNNIIQHNNALVGGGVYCESCLDVTLCNNDISQNTASDGAGIYCTSSSVSINKNDICYNDSAGHGGGIILYSSSSGIVCNNKITDNVSHDSGGGILCSKESSPRIDNNQISYNVAYKGGSICCLDESSPDINGNMIDSNLASNYGGGIYCFDHCSPVISNNMIIYNQAEHATLGDGGGVYLNYSPITPTLLINNTISWNSATRNGGGVYCWNGALTDIVNSILWENSSDNTGWELWVGSHPLNTTIVDVSYSDIRGGYNEPYVKKDAQSILIWGPGIIDSDPLFVDETDGDFHLTYDSPCRDTGNNSEVIEAYDFEGDPRIAWSGIVDMGADEFYNHFYCTGEFTPNGTVEAKFIGLPDTWPVGLFIGSGILHPPIQHKWGAFYLESPWFLFPLVPVPANGVLSFTAALPSTPAPYDIPMQALIGWELSNLFVLEVR